MFGIGKRIHLVPVGVFLTIFMFICGVSTAQTKKTLTINAKFKIDGGGSLSDAYMVLQRDGQSIETLPGQSAYTLNLEIGADYILSFNKPGYITKKININTTGADEERIDQGFESYPFTVVLMKQYDGVNIVIFNQPVAKITYSKKYDEFDYDTDYTKSIQSAIQKAEEDLKKAEKEFKKNPPKPAVDSTLVANKTKTEKKKAQKEKPKTESQEKPVAVKEKSKVEEKNNESKTTNKSATANGGQDQPLKPTQGGGSDEPEGNLDSEKGADNKAAIEPTAGNDAIKNKIGLTKGADQPPAEEPTKSQPVIVKTPEKPVPEKPKEVVVHTAPTPPENVSVRREQIAEDKKTVYNVWVTKGNKTVLYSKVVYAWGGVYFFRDLNTSISENMYRQADGGLVNF